MCKTIKGRAYLLTLHYLTPSAPAMHCSKHRQAVADRPVGSLGHSGHDKAPEASSWFARDLKATVVPGAQYARGYATGTPSQYSTDRLTDHHSAAQLGRAGRGEWPCHRW